MSRSSDFATCIVRWQKQHGRNHLPWQVRDPYRVWLSEIMLQQTQVTTVLGYFARFVQRFPDVTALAAATLDEVLALWSGLGYYSRARNLHRCAQAVVAQHGGQFPQDAQTLATLPGIGRSTAAAIASLCFAERVAIMDANVRRVVSRVAGFEGDLAQAAQERALWQRATDLLPQPQHAARDMPAYTQGMMDLGAMLCTPRRPRCTDCPVSEACVAQRLGAPERFPVKTRKLKRSALSLWLVLARTADGQVWLAPRPTPGVWAGLYCLPLFESHEAMRQALESGPAGQAVRDAQWMAGEVLTHVLTHKDLHLHFWHLDLSAAVAGQRLQAQGQWVATADWPKLGLPAPIRKYLERQAR